MKFETRKYQEDVVESLWESIHDDNGELDYNVHPLVAAPTGSGKSVILGMFLEKYHKEYPDDNILVLSHTQTILEQDLNALREFFPTTPIGLYSSGLGSKEIEQITVAGIQSAYRNLSKFKWFNIIFVDEVHSVNHKSEGMYRALLDNSHAVKIGMSATIFRTGHGYIHQGKGTLFNRLAHDLTSRENFNKLVDDGYLCNLIPVAPSVQLNSNMVKKSAGDYNVKDLARTHDKEYITQAAIGNILHYAEKYRKWLVFAIDIDHADHVAEALRKNGIEAKSMHSKTEDDRRDIIQEFKDRKFRALVSVGMITTGFDDPEVDCIILLRPTLSPVLHVQMIGRGLRISPGKDHCLVLDFAGNTQRLGPINNVRIPTKCRSGELPGLAPTKICKECRVINPISATECYVCGYEFVKKTKLTPTASTSEIIDRQTTAQEPQEPQWTRVDKVTYQIHSKQGQPDSIKVTYLCGLQTIKEWWCPEHNGFAGKKAAHMLGYRGYKGDLSCKSVIENSNKIRSPKSIKVDKTGKYPVIKDYNF